MTIQERKVKLIAAMIVINRPGEEQVLLDAIVNVIQANLNYLYEMELSLYSLTALDTILSGKEDA